MGDDAWNRAPGAAPTDPDQVIKEHGARVLALVAWRARTAQDAEDICQALFLELWQAHRRGGIYGDPAAFLFGRIGVRVIDFYRRRGEIVDDAVVAANLADPGFDLWLSNPEIDAALHELPLEHRRVVVLRFSYDLSQQVIADVLGISESTVKRHLKAGLRRLREILNPPTEPLDPPLTKDPDMNQLDEDGRA